MPYKILLLPKQRESLTIKALQERFRPIGFRIDTERPIASRGDLKGLVVFHDDDERGVHASVLIGPAALGSLGEEVISLVEFLAWVAEQTGTILVDQDHAVDPSDQAALLACAERIAAAQLAKGRGSLWIPRDTSGSPGHFDSQT